MDTHRVIQMMKLDKNYDNFVSIGYCLGVNSMYVFYFIDMYFYIYKIIFLDYLYPNTFDGLCIIEPVIKGSISNTSNRSKLQFMNALKRRNK
ncbi:hypothetical protein BDF14DRAFT_1939254 [Spinellus fusiger]|nr:hypothetical protein BDF14DRAFT_1939254 [Spinellus fusiger]